MYRFLFITFLFVSSHFCLHADEGMWIPSLLQEYGIIDRMHAEGLELSAEDIYSINTSSIKDAVIWFGRGCTGEIISSDGLLLTNHHCGYSQIQRHSSVDNDYLTDGFWAMNRGQELSNPGLTVTFIRRIEDVTDHVLHGVNPSLSQEERDKMVEDNIYSVSKDLEEPHLEAFVRAFYAGNRYFMFVTETFRDIRLVGAPPSSIGKFGGDTDNWMWPRHTGDFSLFRIYAGPDNLPADYSVDNQPYEPRHHLPISLKGAEQGDFTMVMGFPGRTDEYLPPAAVDNIYSVYNPARIEIREKRLAIMDEEMQRNDTVRIQYASKHARVSNYYKKWQGENRGLKKLDAIDTKRQEQQEFREWVNADSERKEQYGHLPEAYQETHEKLQELELTLNYVNEAAFGVEMSALANQFRTLAKISEEKEISDSVINLEIMRLEGYARSFYRDYYKPLDKRVFAAMMEFYYNDVPRKYRPEALNNISKYDGNWQEMADDIYSKSIFPNQEELLEFLKDYKKKKVKKLKKDPGYEIMIGIIENYLNNVRPAKDSLDNKLANLNRVYMEALLERDPLIYPDANSTMRITFGEISGYEPADGAYYEPFSTLEGVIEKWDPNNTEFHVPDKLLQLYREKDYGQYGTNDTMYVCFIATNHTTGGNSGSPVMNSKGHLIGTNFDRNWEGTMSDIMYDPNRVRNISVDIRYTLFIIDKFAGAGHLVEEMTIVE
ncbi:MAG: S46 family peptidase [Bacteroidia bacterium]